MPPGLHIEFLSREHYANAYDYYYPHEVFSQWVDFAWQSRFDSNQLQKLDELEFAHTSSSIVFNQGSPFIISANNGDSLAIDEPIIIGHQSKPLIFNHNKENKLYGIKLRAAGFYALFGIPAHELNNKIIPLGQLLKVQGFAVKDLNSIYSFLARYKKEPDYIKVNSIRKALINYSSSINENKSVGEIAYDNCISHKTLTRYFLEVMGMQPRKALSIMRMRIALQAYLNKGEDFSVYDYGYYDYSHFHKDITTYTSLRLSELRQG